MIHQDFRQFEHLYLFVTEECQLRCHHCYMGSRLERAATLDLITAKRIVDHFFNLGTRSIVLVGGEPTLYTNLKEIINYAKLLGYKDIVVDSNGISVRSLININRFDVDHIRISLDGASPQTHEKIRGIGNYSKTISGIKRLINEGYSVWITSTIFQFNFFEIEELLAIADNLGVKVVNFHIFSEEGNGINYKNWSINPYDWISCYEKFDIMAKKYKVKIKYPPAWVKKIDLESIIRKGYLGCQGISMNQVSAFPDGRCYICPLIFDQEMNFGNFSNEGITINKGLNEYELFLRNRIRNEINGYCGCPAETILDKENQKNKFPDLVSLCRLWRTEA